MTDHKMVPAAFAQPGKAMFDADDAAGLTMTVEGARVHSGADRVVMTMRGLNGESVTRRVARFDGGRERVLGRNSAAIVFTPRDTLLGASTRPGVPIQPAEAQRQAMVDETKTFARAGDFQSAATVSIEGTEVALARPVERVSGAVVRTQT